MIALIPCSASKRPDRGLPAAELYSSSPHFRFTLRSVEEGLALRTELGLVGDRRVVIVSALHGFVELSDVLNPYDVRIGTSGSISDPSRTDELVASLQELDLAGPSSRRGTEYVVSFLPAAYLAAVRRVLRVDFDRFEGARGIGDQRGRLADFARRGTVDSRG